MERELFVLADIQSMPIPVGRLWVRHKHGKETATFQYAQSWLKHPARFALAPNLPLNPNPFQSPDRLFNAFSDAAPDRWGQKLMRHHERNRAREAGVQPKTMLSSDFLAGVDDETRMGALRFKEGIDGEFLTTTGKPVPPLIELKTLLSATDRIERGKERKSDVALVLAPGGSLGGARPKATVRDRDGKLLLAKFPWAQDEWPVIQWEWATLRIAKAAGVDVPGFRIEKVGSKLVLMIDRFDRRENGVRLPFMSAFTALDARDHDEDRSYLELVDALRQLGEAPRADLHQLFRRVVFNVLVSNTDDHLRNHGFLRGADGWRLAPAYDMNPTPIDVSARVHVLAINEIEHSGSIDLVLSTHDYFALKLSEGRAIAGEVASAVAEWRTVAASCKLSKNDIERMESAFAHDDLNQALAMSTVPVAPLRRAAAMPKQTRTKTPAAKKVSHRITKAKKVAPAKTRSKRKG